MAVMRCCRWREGLLDCDSPHVGAALRAISEATRGDPWAGRRRVQPDQRARGDVSRWLSKTAALMA